MNVLEVLHLRLAGDDLEEIVDLVRRATEGHEDPSSLCIYRHSRVQGDLLIHLRRAEPSQTNQPSELGLGLAALLRMHGLVEHSVWVWAGGAEECSEIIESKGKGP